MPCTYCCRSSSGVRWRIVSCEAPVLAPLAIIQDYWAAPYTDCGGELTTLTASASRPQGVLSTCTSEECYGGGFGTYQCIRTCAGAPFSCASILPDGDCGIANGAPVGNYVYVDYREPSPSVEVWRTPYSLPATWAHFSFPSAVCALDTPVWWSEAVADVGFSTARGMMQSALQLLADWSRGSPAS